MYDFYCNILKEVNSRVHLPNNAGHVVFLKTFFVSEGENLLRTFSNALIEQETTKFWDLESDTVFK